MTIAPGYLAEVEASSVSLSAGAAVVFLQLCRDIAGEREAGRKARRMVIELSVSEAVQFHQMLGAAIGEALALGSQPSGVDSASNL